MQLYYYCLDLVVSTLPEKKKKLKYSLATSGSCSCKGYINRTQVLSKDQQKFEHRFQWLYQVLQ